MTLPPTRAAPLEIEAMAPPVFVAGDVHLGVEEPVVVDRFLAWLDGLQGRGGTLILLGDVFDLWAGRRQQVDDLPRRVLGHLRALAASGTRLAFVPGNRDFLFDGADGLDIELWSDPVRTRWGERRVLLTHGDRLCTADVSYQRMRRFLYGPGGQILDWTVPYRARRWLAEGMRNLSRRETGRKSRATMDIDYGEARTWMERFDVDLLVAGHVHTGVHHRLTGGPDREVMVLKDWERGGGIVCFDEHGVRLEPPSGAR